MNRYRQISSRGNLGEISLKIFSHKINITTLSLENMSRTPSWFLKKSDQGSTGLVPRMNRPIAASPIVVEPVSVKFKTDYNINMLDNMIKSKLMSEMNDLGSLYSNLQALTLELSRVTTVVSHNTVLKKIESLKIKINEIQYGSRAMRYLNESKPLLDKYNSIPKHVKYVDISDRNTDRDEHEVVDSDDQERIDCIMKFLSIASSYIQLDITRERDIQPINKCKNCGYNLKDVEIDIDGQQVCPCGYGRYKNKMDTMIDCGIPISPNKDYSDENNFKKTLIRFMGMQKINYDIQAVCDELDRYFISIGHKPAIYYRTMAPDAYGRKDGTSLSLLLDGLKEIKQPKLYEDANLIGSHLWGWVLLDLTGILETIMSDYRETQKVYESRPTSSRGRKSCLSTQLRMYGHLLIRGAMVQRNQFKIPKQRESLIKQDQLWMEMCQGANNPNIYYVSLL